MKKRITMSLYTVTIVLALSGCGKSAIKCDDSEAKNLVMEIAEVELKNQLTRGLSPYISSYEQLKNLQSTDAVAIENKQKMIQTVEELYKKNAPKLVNIRVEKLDDSLEKSECSADIEFSNGKKGAITYKLSKTSENQLYAEVFGLQ